MVRVNVHPLPLGTMLLCVGKGSFFKPHVDAPRGNKVFGSLVVAFPSPHEGGALLFRHRGHEWTFDSGKALAAAKNDSEPSIGYVAFFSDIEHEVALVTSGHCITLTYHLYFDDGGPVSPNDVANPKHLTSPQLVNKDAYRVAFTALLEDPEFLADGGTLAFGLRHVYPIKDDLKHVYSVLRGSDAVVYESALDLGYEPVLYVHYETGESLGRGVMINKELYFYWEDSLPQDDGVLQILKNEGGIPVCRADEEMEDDPQLGAPEYVEWVTPTTTFNCRKDAFVSYGVSGDEPTLEWAYGDVCLVIRIGKVGNRLAYPTHAQLNSAYWSHGDHDSGRTNFRYRFRDCD